MIGVNFRRFVPLQASRHFDVMRPTAPPLKKAPSTPSRLGTLVLALSLAWPAALPAPAAAQVNLPALGDSVSADFGIGAEKRLGDQVMREIRVDPDYLDDPILLDYLNTIWHRLVEASLKKGNITPDMNERYAWEPFLVRDRTVNAFALPGGYIGVNLGLIQMTTNQDELASVLAHELSHITQRHIARGMVNSQRQSLLSMAAMIIGLIAAASSRSADGANAVIAGSQAAGIQGQLNFSRDVEREADRVGYGVLTAAGFAPWGMAAMFEKLDATARLTDSNNYPYLRTHPLTTERIGEAFSRMGPASAQRGDFKPTGSALEHAVMQARARVLMDGRVESLQRLQRLDTANDAEVESATAPLPVPPSLAASAAALPTSSPVALRLIALCSSAMASAALRDPARSDAAMQRALALVQSTPRSDARAVRAVKLVQAQILIDRDDDMRAVEVLQPYAGDGTRAVSIMRAEIALDPKQRDSQALGRSAEDLQTRVANTPLDATAWLLLSRLDDRLGQPLRSLRAQAEARYALGDLSGAIDRLRAGRLAGRAGGTPDFIEASVIEARLRDIETQRKQLAAEMRGGRGGSDDAPP